MYKVVFTPLAKKDIENSLLYISKTLMSPQAARGSVDELKKQISIIESFPFAAELYKTEYPLDHEVRQVLVKNYILFFTANKTEITIMRFLHKKTDRSNLFI